MRIFFVALFIVTSFVQPLCAMDKQIVATDSQELFDSFYYPISSEKLQAFSKGRQEALSGNLQSLKLLAADAHNPCVRSIRELISHELKKENFTEASRWCSYALRLADQGIMLDPSIAQCYAGLLDAADDCSITHLQSISPFARENKIQQLINYACVPHLFAVPESQNLFFYTSAGAVSTRDFLENSKYKRFQEIIEKGLDSFGQQELEEIQTLHTLPSACYFIKKHLSKNSQASKDFNPALALYHAQSVLDARDTKNYFMQTGAYSLLQSYAQGKKPNKHQLNAAFVLAELEDDPILALDYIKPVLKNLHRVPESDFPFLAQKLVRMLEEAMESNSSCAVAAWEQFIKSPGYAQHKKNLSAGDSVYARDFALQLYSYSKRLAVQTEHQAFCTLAKSEAISLLQSAAEKGDALASWKFLSLKEVIGSDAQLLAQALEKTRTTVHRIELADVTSAIKNVQNCNDPSVALVLAELFATGLEGYISRDEGQALKYCMLSGSKGIDILMNRAASFKNPEVCFFAAVHLHSQREIGEPVLTMANSYLDKARQNALDNISLQKMIIKFGIEHRELFDHAMIALSDLCQKFGEDLTFWKTEKQFINEVIDLLSNNASNGDMRSTVFLAQVLRDCADLIQHPKIDDCKKTAQFYRYRAAIAGHESSLFELLPEYEELLGLPVTDESYQQAAQYWNALYNAAQKMNTESEKKKWEELAISKTRALVKFQREFVTKEILSDEDPAFYYHCIGTLYKTDVEMAIECLSKAESFMIKNKYDRNLLYLTGVNDCIQHNISLKKGWAYYAKAIVKMCRSQIAIEPDIRKHVQNIEQLKEVQNLILLARSAQEPYENSEILEEYKIEHMLGTEYVTISKLAGLETDFGKDSLETGLVYLEKATQKGCAESAFEWAHVCLSQRRAQKGQEVFEKVVDHLITAKRNGSQRAAHRLDDIYHSGFEFTPLCGGTMTAELFQKIKKELNPQLNEFPGIEKGHELLLDTPRAIKYFQNQEYEKAYALFKQQAEKDDVEALVYLGIMHRDGLCGEKSAAIANSFFIKALMTWDGSEKVCFILNNADEALNDLVGHDLAARVARALYLAGLVSPLRNPEKSQFDLVSRELCVAEQMAQNSKNPEDHARLFDSRLAHRINAIITDAKPSLSFIIDVVSCYAKRISKLGLPSSEIQIVQLLSPMLFLSEIVAEVINNVKPVAIFQNISDEKLGNLINNLECAIKSAPQSTSPSLEYLVGMIHIAAGEKRSVARVKDGVNFIKHAAEQRVACARHMLAFLQLYGSRISKEITLDKKNAVAALEDLASQGDSNAMITLSKYYYSDKGENKKNAKKASQLLEQIILKDPKHREANFLCAEVYCTHPSLVNNNFRRIYDLFEVIGTDDQCGESARLYQIFLSLTHERSLMSSSMVTQRLLQILHHATLYQDDVTCLINALTRKRKFNETLDSWFKDTYTSISNDEQRSEASRAATAIGWWYMVIAKIKASMKEPWHNEYAAALEYLQKSVDYCPDAVLGRALIAAIYQETCYNRLDLDKSKTQILLACSALGKRKLKLKDEPILSKVIDEFKKANAVIRAENVVRDFSKIISQADFEKMYNNLDLIRKLEAMYS